MKILMLCGNMDHGGAETHIATLCRELSKLGCKITAVTPGGETAEAMERTGIRILRLPIQSKNPLIRFYTVQQLKKHLKSEEYDILHAHTRLSARFLKHIGKASTSHRKKTAKIVTVHAKFRHFPFERKLCYWGEYTVAVSEDLRRYAIHTYRIPPERIRVIPNGIDLSRFSPDQERISKRKNTDLYTENEYMSCKKEENTKNPTRSLNIVFASRMDRNCALGAKLLLELAPVLCREFSDLTIHLAGGGNNSESMRKKANKINSELGREAISVLGHITNMPELLREADIFVGVSRAAMEAALMGCAVILCGNEGYGGILSFENAPFHSLSNYCARQATKASADLLKQDLLLLLKDHRACDFYASSAMQWMQTYHDGDTMGRLTLSLYHRAQYVKKDRRILAGGYFGCGNLGDDAILLGMREGLWELASAVQLTALASHPQKIQKKLAIPAYKRKSLFGLIHGLLYANLYVCGGGSLLQNKSGNRSLLYYLWTIRLGNLMRKSTVLFAAGIGPLSGSSARKKTMEVLKKCRYISLRDGDSLQFLRQNGLIERPLFESADPALLLSPPPSTRGTFLLSEHGILHNVRYFCIILKGGRESGDIARLILGAARVLALRHSITPILLTFDTYTDTPIMKQALKHLEGAVAVPIEEVHDAIALFERAELVLSMRLHGVILSTVAATPALGVVSDAQDGKIPSFARQSGQEYLLPGEVSVGAVTERAEKMIAERETRSRFLRSVLADLRKKAKKDLENLLVILYNNKQNE